MNDTSLLIGSLSNDLFRVATLAQRGSIEAAARFLIEAKRWSKQLENAELPGHIADIVRRIIEFEQDPISLYSAENMLMYGVLLQNYSLHM